MAELLAFLRSSCPDVLVLGLLQINPPITLLRQRQELLGKLLTVFLVPHLNSGVSLTHAWYSQSIQIKLILMLSMADWYLAGQEGVKEHSRLSCILDVAQDLKAPSMMLNGQPYPFVIDLTILASRREYLNQEKWLGDKIREIFVAATVKLMQCKIPAVIVLNEDSVPKQTLPVDCLATIILGLQEAGHSMCLGQEVAETIFAMVSVHGSVLPRPHPPTLTPPGVLRGPTLSCLGPPGGSLVFGLGSPNRMYGNSTSVKGTQSPFSVLLAPHPAPPTPRPYVAPPSISTNPIEHVISGNLAGIFPEVTGPVSRELLLLKKFQTSGVQREQGEFNCMIKNLFEEYKFFPQYPDKVHHNTAQLFGGIIEHNLIQTEGEHRWYWIRS